MMPKFESVDPSEIVIGRGQAEYAYRAPFRDAIRDGDAGSVTLDAGDDPAKVKRAMRHASREVGIRVRSSWEDDSRRVLLWKRTGVGGPVHRGSR
jgi:hypothetical protein